MVGSKLEVDIKDTDICTTHRLPSKSTAPTVVVKFNNYETKNNLIKAAKIKKIKSDAIG